MTWDTSLALLALLISAGIAINAALSRRFDSSLSIREHNEFKDRIIKMIDDHKDQSRRDDDRLERDIKFLQNKCLREINEGKS